MGYIHDGIEEAFSRGFINVCVETKHVESFRILRRQNFEDADLFGPVAPIQAINACNPLFPCDTEPIYRIYPVLAERNQDANFNLSLLNLTELLDADIGWGPNISSLELQPNYGLGEVIQGPKPKKKKRRLCFRARNTSLCSVFQKK